LEILLVYRWEDIARIKVILAGIHIASLTDFWTMESVIYKVIEKLLRFGIKEIDLILLRDVCGKN